MDNLLTLEPTIFMASHPHLVKRFSISSLIFSLVLLTVGMGLFLSAFQLNDNSSTLGMFLMVAGTAALLTGIFRLFWKSKETFYEPTGSVMKELSMYFDLKDSDDLSEMFDEGRFPLDKSIKSVGNGKVRLDVLRSQDAKFAAAQLFQYEPYTYNPVTRVYYFTGDKALAFITYLQKCR